MGKNRASKPRAARPPERAGTVARGRARRSGI